LLFSSVTETGCGIQVHGTPVPEIVNGGPESPCEGVEIMVAGDDDARHFVR